MAENGGMRGMLTRALQGRRLRRRTFDAVSAMGYGLYRDFGDHRLVFDPAETIGKHLVRYHEFERGKITEIALRVAQMHGAGGVFLELGANIGTQFVYAGLAHAFDRMLAVEPDPANLGYLRANIALNGMGARAEVAPVAVSDGPGTATLRRNARNSGAATLRDEGGTGETVDVPMLTTDALLVERGIAPADLALIWMDVEGLEARVLAGMTATLAAAPPLFMEYTPDWNDADQKAAIEELLFGTYAKIEAHGPEKIAIDRAGFRALTTQVDLFAYG